MVTITLDETIDSKLLRKKMDRKMNREWKVVARDNTTTYGSLLRTCIISFENGYVYILCKCTADCSMSRMCFFHFLYMSIRRDTYFNEADAKKIQIITQSACCDKGGDPLGGSDDVCWTEPMVRGVAHPMKNISLSRRIPIVDGPYI